MTGELKEATEKSCPRCDYDEAEGGLLNHCDACCRRIATVAYELAHKVPTNPVIPLLDQGSKKLLLEAQLVLKAINERLPKEEKFLKNEVKVAHNALNGVRWAVGEYDADRSPVTGPFNSVEELTKHLESLDPRKCEHGEWKGECLVCLEKPLPTDDYLIARAMDEGSIVRGKGTYVALARLVNEVRYGDRRRAEEKS